MISIAVSLSYYKLGRRVQYDELVAPYSSSLFITRLMSLRILQTIERSCLWCDGNRLCLHLAFWFWVRGPCFQAPLILCIILLLLVNIILTQIISGLVPLPLAFLLLSVGLVMSALEWEVHRAEAFIIHYVSLHG
jgi:hypothetical protein